MICLVLFIFLLVSLVRAFFSSERYKVEVLPPLSDHRTVEQFVQNVPVSILLYFLIFLWEVSGFIAVVLINVVVFKNPARNMKLSSG